MLLAVDTSTMQVGVALYEGNQVVGESLWYGKLRHTTSLAPEIEALLKRANRRMDELTALGVALGPGSFTSLRVGLALIKGLAIARRLPIIGIPTLDILAAAQPICDRRLLCVLQAGRGRLAVGGYRSSGGAWHAEGELRVMRVDELAVSLQAPVLICGELSAEEREILRKEPLAELCSPTRSSRRAAWLAELAWQRYQAGETDAPAALSPIYLQVGAAIPL